jgi:hypothetical protein
MFLSSYDQTISPIIKNESELSKYIKINFFLLEGNFVKFQYTKKKINLIPCDKRVFKTRFALASFCIAPN